MTDHVAATGPPLERRWRPPQPLSVGLVLAGLRRGSGDPTYRRDPDGTVWRGVRTPAGPATLRLRQRLAEVDASAWGPGAGWLLDSVPAMCGGLDDPREFRPRHPAVQLAARLHPGWRVPRTGLVLEALIPAIIEQKVTGEEAFAGYRTLVHRFGERAPGAGAARGLWVPPSALAWTRIPSWEWLRAAVDGARSRAAVQAAGAAGRLEECASMSGPDAERRLRVIPGIGRWTAAEVRQRALGDADAVSFGDYHVAKNIGWALVGEEVDDDGMAELLEPYAGHRFRVQRLLELAGVGRPRRGPRMAPRRHLPGRYA
ncbi:MAG TPA: DNA-3-methyladenine glycosylase 2 family protein [Dermatophilaceae bacterium]|nr:DNA-3-methyladenine glycosylase 2 family protein [Dermatophilaceae bacterium]